MDKVFLKGMHFYGYHGVFEEENRLGQKFIVDVEMSCSLKEASSYDDVSLTINYAKIYETVKREVEETRVNLIETLAEHIAKKILTQFSVHEVCVRVNKPDAPIPGHFHSIGVEVVRNYEDVSG